MIGAISSKQQGFLTLQELRQSPDLQFVYVNADSDLLNRAAVHSAFKMP